MPTDQGQRHIGGYLPVRGTIGCGSFSDNNLHSRGSFRGWQQIASREKFLYTHRGGKWATIYSASARDAQLAFFDRYLRGRDVATPPRVRLEVRDTRDRITRVRAEDSWPLARTQWTPLYLTAGRAGQHTGSSRWPHHLQPARPGRVLRLGRARRHRGHLPDGTPAVGRGAWCR
jgi:predicted acyl esterase